MANNNTNAVQFSGPYLIQDMDHLATPVQSASKAKRPQADQSHGGSRQQNAGKSRGGQRQAH